MEEASGSRRTRHNQWIRQVEIIRIVRRNTKRNDDATNTDARERLVEDCHLADDEVRNLEEEYNKIVEDVENTKVQRLKKHNYKVAQAKDALEKFDKSLLQEEKKEANAALSLDIQYKMFKCKRFLDKDRSGSDWIRHAMSMIQRDIDEFGSVSALAIESISESNIQMKVIQELDLSRNLLRKSLKEAEEHLTRESKENKALEGSMLRVAQESSIDSAKSAPLDVVASMVSFSDVDGSPVVDSNKDNVETEQLRLFFRHIVKYIACFHHGLMDEIARRNVLEDELAEMTKLVNDLRENVAMHERMKKTANEESEALRKSKDKLLEVISKHEQEIQTLQVNLNTSKSRVRRDAIENQTLDEDKRLLAKEIDTLKRTLKAEARKSSGWKWISTLKSKFQMSVWL